MNFKNYQDKVVSIAKEKLKTYGIFKICLDTLKESYNKNLNIEDAATNVIDDTLYWESCW